jgi:hypothetical protein
MQEMRNSIKRGRGGSDMSYKHGAPTGANMFEIIWYKKDSVRSLVFVEKCIVILIDSVSPLLQII